MAAAHTNGGALGARVDNLEGVASAIRVDIAELRTLVVASQKTPWSTLIAAAGFIVIVTTGFSQLSLAPIRDATGRNSDDIKEINRAIVPRGEHEGHWANTDAAITNLQKQIDQQRQDFGSTYSLRDALSDMQKRLDKLEDTKKGLER